MFSDFDALYYFDELLIRQIGSFVIEGYIDVFTRRDIVDRTLTGKANVDNRESNSFDKRKVKDEREGYVTENKNEGEGCQKACDNSAGVENREFVRVENEVKRIYTAFNIYRNVCNILNTTSKYREISERDIITNNLMDGEVVEINCSLTDYSPYKCVETIADILNALGKDTILNLMKKKGVVPPEDFDLDRVFALINLLNNKLKTSEHRDILVTVGETPVVLCINSGCYCNNKESLIKGCGCNLKVVGKVVKNCTNGEGLNLFRKLGECNFYDEMLGDLLKDIKVINRCNLYMPEEINTYVGGIGAIILPISIFN